MKGWIYVAHNKSLSSMLKIGFSDRHPGFRMSELSGTNLPTPFECLYAALCEDAQTLERKVHRRLAGCRLSQGREFFEVSLDDAISTIREIADEEGLILDYQELQAQVDLESLSLLDAREVLRSFSKGLYLRLKEWKNAASRLGNEKLYDELIDFEVDLKNKLDEIARSQLINNYMNGANAHKSSGKSERVKFVELCLRQKCERDLCRFKRFMRNVDGALHYLPPT